MRADFGAGGGETFRQLTVEQIDLWVAAAATGARLIYGAGEFAPDAAGEAVAARMYHLERYELVLLVQRRVAPGRYHYTAVRSARNLPTRFPDLPRLTQGGNVPESMQDRVMRVLEAEAAKGGDWLQIVRIAERLGAIDGSVSRAVSDLERMGKIETLSEGGKRFARLPRVGPLQKAARLMAAREREMA